MDHKELESLISDYKFFKREIKRLEESLYRLGGGFATKTSNGVAQYGIEATLPKSSGLISKAELDDLDKREQHILKRIMKYQTKVTFIECAEESLTDMTQQTLYSCMMEGMSYRAIGKHLGVSREQVRRLRNDLMCHLCHLCQNDQLCHLWHDLKYKI